MDEIVKKHKAVQLTEGEKRRRRKKYEEEQKEMRRRRRMRVISSKLKNKKKKEKQTTVVTCQECGEVHAKRNYTCRVGKHMNILHI